MTYENTSADVCSGAISGAYQANITGPRFENNTTSIRAAVAAILSGDYDDEQYAEHVQTLAEARVSGCEILRLKHLGCARRKSADSMHSASTL